MKRIVLLAFCVIATIQGHCIVNYTFSDTVPTGQTLYFTVLPNGSVQVVAPNLHVYSNGSTYYDWSGYDSPTGILSIPDSIHHNNNTYAISVIGKNAFRSCSGLTTVTISNTITKIDTSAFDFCSGLASIQMGNAVDTIEKDAFGFCSGLSTIRIPENVKYIGPGAFRNCSNLSHVDFCADSCSEIGLLGTNSYLSAFDNCNSLTKVSIGSNVRNIPRCAFYNCSSLDTVLVYPSIPPNLGIGAFYNNAPCRVIVLLGCNYEGYVYSWSVNPIYCGGAYHSPYVEPIVDINISLSSNHGTASIIPIRGHDVSCDSTVIIQTQCDSDLYHFDHWSNGNTTNPDTLHLVGDTTVTAYYISLTLNTNIDFDITMVSHHKIRDHVEVIEAWPPYGYHFDHWSNGSTADRDTIFLQGDSTITAFFERNQYSLALIVNDTTLGTAAFPNGNTLLYGDTIFAVAYPNSHYHVEKWSYLSLYDSIYIAFQYGQDTLQHLMIGNITVHSTILCSFAIDTHTVSVLPNDSDRGTVTGGGVFTYGTPCIVQAYPYSGYTFDHWSNGVTDNPFAFPATEDVELQAIFLAPDEVSYTVTAVCDNPIMGSATVNGLSSVTMMNGEEVTLIATPNQGYRFLHWQDNDTNCIRLVMVTSDSIFTAFFEAEGGTEDIDGIDVEYIHIYTTEGYIVVEGTNEKMMVFDMTGRSVRNDSLPMGVYMVKIGNHPARKVVVIR